MKEKDELTEIIKFLVQVNAFIIHIPFLERLNKSNFLQKRFNRHLFQISSNNNQISFGIYNETLQHVYLLNDNFNEQVNLKQAKNEF